MPHRVLGIGFITLLIAISCSCSQGGSRFGVIKPVSEICVERLDNNYFPLGNTAVADTSATGDITVRYRFFSNNCLCTSSPLLVIDNPADWDVIVDGEELMPINMLHLLEDSDACFELGGKVHNGENIITLRCSGKALPAALPSVFIAGEFDVLPDDETGWMLTSAKVPSLGSWASQGMPFYRSDVAYRRTFEVTGKVRKRTFLRLGEWNGTLCEVLVNGKKAGEIPAKHNKLKIGRFLQPGLNEIEMHVTGDGLYEEFTIN